MHSTRPVILGALLILANVCSGQEVIRKYIDRFLPVATDLSSQYGIPVSIILGVSILESGSGTSKNCRQLHNYFGVTGRNKLRKRRSAYKQYATPEDSFRDFCNILSRKKYYPKLKNTILYSKWLAAMNHASYAGAKQVWIKRITNVIVKHQLSKYDMK